MWGAGPCGGINRLGVLAELSTKHWRYSLRIVRCERKEKNREDCETGDFENVQPLQTAQVDTIKKWLWVKVKSKSKAKAKSVTVKPFQRSNVAPQSTIHSHNGPCKNTQCASQILFLKHWGLQEVPLPQQARRGEDFAGVALSNWVNSPEAHKVLERILSPKRIF